MNYIKTSLLEQSEFSTVYMDKLNEICDNLDMKNNKINNKTLLPALLDNSISPQTLPFLKMYQLHPQRWKYIIDKNKF